MKASDSAKKKPSSQKPEPKPKASFRFPLTFWKTWLASAAVLALLFTVVAKVQRFGIDNQVARWIQRQDSTKHAWAKYLTDAASPPLVYGLLGVASVLAWRFANWRLALVPTLSYAASLGADRWLKPMIARPRPGLLSTGYGCPSTAGLVYMATIGVVIWAGWKSSGGGVRWTITGVGVALLLLGMAARVVLGAHWPSDMLLSYALGTLFITGIARVLGVR